MGLSTGIAYESERNTNLESITRLTQLYDLERSFNSTLEMDDLLPLIAGKYRELLNVQAVNLWMVEDEAARLMNRAGTDKTVELETVQGAGQGMTGDLLESAEAVVIGHPDERLRKRNEGVEDGAIFSMMAAPLIHEDAVVGLVECINKLDGAPFDEDDLFFLTTVNVTASSALHNASLLEAERKIEILETLVEVSNEITSTLNLERVLQVVVNGPQKIMTYDRAAVALENKGKLQLKCVSGKKEIATGDPQMRALKEVLEFSAMFDKPLHVIAHDETVEADREETRARFHEYFQQTGTRGWYAVPLADDQGKLGVLSFESTNPDFLAEAQFEFINVVASQATVALRNASLYEEVPLIGVLEPILEKKRRFMAMEKRRRATTAAAALAVVLALVLVPLPMRISGESTVAPQSSARVQAEVDGVIRNVYVRESGRVAKGTVLADMDDWDYRAAFAAAQARRDTALAAMNRALAANDGTEAGIERVQADYWAAETTRARERLERTKLRSPIDGAIATPHIETLTGRKLEAGDNFAVVINTANATLDVAIAETDLPLIRAGDNASVKLESFPLRKYRGVVSVISPNSSVDGDKRVFYARVQVPNPDGSIRAGMKGLTKIWTGWRPAGYVMFRGVGMWLWTKLWNWFGW
jgi:RND family efflux transporter MFP subunit